MNSNVHPSAGPSRDSVRGIGAHALALARVAVAGGVIASAFSGAAGAAPSVQVWVSATGALLALLFKLLHVY